MGLCYSVYLKCCDTSDTCDYPIWEDVNMPIVYAVCCDERYDDGPYR